MLFIEKGYVKAEPTKISDEAMLNNLKEVQEMLRKERAGVWEFSDKEESSS